MGAYSFAEKFLFNDRNFHCHLFVQLNKFSKNTKSYEKAAQYNMDRFIIISGHVISDTRFPLSRSPTPF